MGKQPKQQHGDLKNSNSAVPSERCATLVLTGVCTRASCPLLADVCGERAVATEAATARRAHPEARRVRAGPRRAAWPHGHAYLTARTLCESTFRVP